MKIMRVMILAIWETLCVDFYFLAFLLDCDDIIDDLLQNIFHNFVISKGRVNFLIS